MTELVLQCLGTLFFFNNPYVIRKLLDEGNLIIQTIGESIISNQLPESIKTKAFVFLINLLVGSEICIQNFVLN